MKGLLRASVAGVLGISVLVAAGGLRAEHGHELRAEHEHKEEQAERLALEGMEKLFRALELFIESIPQYEVPEVTEEGDIIIRRKRRPEGLEPPHPESDMDETRT